MPLYLQNSKELLRKHNTINNFQHLISSIIISLHAITRSINEYRSVFMTVCLSIYIKLHIILFGIHHGKSDTARKLDRCSITSCTNKILFQLLITLFLFALKSKFVVVIVGNAFVSAFIKGLLFPSLISFILIARSSGIEWEATFETAPSYTKSPLFSFCSLDSRYAFVR